MVAIPQKSSSDGMSPASAPVDGIQRGWMVHTIAGPVQQLQDLENPHDLIRTVRVMQPESSAVALGSSQRNEVIDRERAISAGLRIARRRSGGGVVLIVPGQQAWVEFLVPRGDPLWNDDIVRASFWVGDIWCETLAAVGMPGGTVHRGRSEVGDWSDTVCFAGMGPGEVRVDGRKVMGLSQRRSRDWTRIQTMVHTVWDPETLVGVLDMDDSTRSRCLNEVSNAAREVTAGVDLVVDSLLSRLPD